MPLAVAGTGLLGCHSHGNRHCRTSQRRQIDDLQRADVRRRGLVDLSLYHHRTEPRRRSRSRLPAGPPRGSLQAAKNDATLLIFPFQQWLGSMDKGFKKERKR